MAKTVLATRSTLEIRRVVRLWILGALLLTAPAWSASLGGTVTSGAEAVAGARVTVLSPTATAGIAITASDGSWRLDGLAAGTYVATAEADGLATEAWPDVACLEALCDPRDAGQPIVVAADEERLDVDFALAPGASLAGTVRNGDGEPLAVAIRLYDDSLGVWADQATTTDADGSWRIDGLGAGTYRVATDGAVGFVDELFDGVPCPGRSCDPSAGTAISLVAGAMVAGIDFVLGAEGRISGEVTRAFDGTPVSAGAVRVFSLDGNPLLFAPIVGGAYEIGPLPTGSYYVVAQDTLTEFGRLFPGVPCQNRLGYLGCSLADGQPVTVTAPATTTGIDFALSPAGSVEGRLRDSAGIPLGGVPAVVLDLEGRVIESIQADVLGDFRVDGLRPGPVYVGSSGGDDFVAELYPDTLCPGLTCDLTAAETVEIIPRGLRDGINLVLDRAGALSGRVTGAGGVGLSGATVRALTTDGVLVGEATSAVGGTYTINGLPPVDLVVWASADGHRSVAHDGVLFPVDAADVDLDDGDAFALAAGTVVRPAATGTLTIDFDLDRLPTLAGTVREALSGEPLVGSLVRIWRLDPSPDPVPPVLETSVTVGADGWSATVPPGSYAVATAAAGSFVDEAYVDKPCYDRAPLGVSCDLSEATRFDLDFGDEVSSLTFALEVAGSVAGVVVTEDATDAGGDVFTVGIWSEEGALLARTDVVLDDVADGVPFGAYEFEDLPPGLYYLTVDAPDDYLDLAVGGSSCIGPCDPLAGTPVEVTEALVFFPPVAVVEPCGDACVDETLALRDGRFEVDVRWSDFDGNSGSGSGVPLTDESGYFWFFSDDNVEMVIKVLDACDAFDRFWVFAAGLTNVDVEIDVTDTVEGVTKSYGNPLGTAFEPILDVDAFETCGSMRAAGAPGSTGWTGSTGSSRIAPIGGPRKVGEALSLRDGRFVVTTTWRDFDGNEGDGTGVGLTGESGTFWFFDPANVEVIVKVLDACDAFGRYWVFAAGLTNVEVTLTVTDTQAPPGTPSDEATVVYENPLGAPYAPVLDVGAFATCP